MVWSFPPTRKQLAVTAAWFLSGVALFAAGAHLSYVNVAPQQARTKARDDFVRDYLRKKYGYEGGRKQQRNECMELFPAACGFATSNGGFGYATESAHLIQYISVRQEVH
ncbi:hypothetical protein Taro_014353 [Colocasia esculenta]|uniref:Uncharacterized protein n=1 Tax=Colocasia esculenta TaxID=4460 RepID=A0A843UEM4_COLES|nr:hypothetical protein [Colocasia esculenta]